MLLKMDYNLFSVLIDSADYFLLILSKIFCQGFCIEPLL